MLWLALSLTAAADCTFAVDGQPAERLDCTTGGAWSVTCPLPSPSKGKARVRLQIPARDLQAESTLTLSDAQEPSVTAALGGPANRAGTFVVARAAGGLLPGQAVGPLQLCPVLQPDVPPGSPPQEIELQVEVSVHSHAGFVDEVGPSGVATRVPKWGPGSLHASATVPVRQRPVGGAPLAVDQPPAGSLLPRFVELTGLLQVSTDAGWGSIGYTGLIEDLEGPVAVARFDFVAPVVEQVLGGDALESLEEDLAGWLAGRETPWSRVAWARSEMTPPGTPLTFSTVTEGGRSWRRARNADATLEVRLTRAGDRARVVIATGALGATVVEAASAGLD